MNQAINIFFKQDNPNSPDLRFIEIENDEGESISVGEMGNVGENVFQLRITELPFNGRKTEQSVIKKITERGDIGEQKYGVTLDRKDLSPKQWMQHFQEEMLDGAQYAERCIEAEDMLEQAVLLLSDSTRPVHKAFVERYKTRFQ